MLCDGQLCIGNIAGELIHHGRYRSAALLEGCDLIFQGLYLCGKGATELDDLVNL